MQKERVIKLKKNKLLLMLAVITVLVVAIASVSFAASFKTPAELTAGLTGKSVEQVTEDRAEGKTYGEQAKEAGKLEEFQEGQLELFKQRLDEAVANKRLTQEEADKIYEARKARLAECEGDGSGAGAGFGIGGRMGMRSGLGIGPDGENCPGLGQSLGQAAGQGMGARGGMRGRANAAGNGTVTSQS